MARNGLVLSFGTGSEPNQSISILAAVRHFRSIPPIAHPHHNRPFHGRTLKQPVHRPHSQCPLSLSKYQFSILFSFYCTPGPTIPHCLATATAAAAAATATTLPGIYRYKSYGVHPAAVFPSITMATTAATTPTTTAAAIPTANAGTLPVNEFAIAG